MPVQGKANGEGLGLLGTRPQGSAMQPALGGLTQQVHGGKGGAPLVPLRTLTGTIAFEASVDHSVAQSKQSLVPSPGRGPRGLYE